MKNQDIYQIRQLIPNTYQITEAGSIHTYLLLGSEKALLIDTGNGAGNLREIVEQITSLPVEPVITHRHSDHIGGGGWFDQVLVPEGDMAKEYDGSSGRIGSQVSRFAMHWAGNYPKQPHAPNKISLEYGHVFDLGERRIQMMHSPGHTKGSAIYIDEGEKLIFVGDNAGTQQLLIFPGTAPLQIWLDSVKKIREISEGCRMFWGHADGTITRPQLDALIRMGEEILAANPSNQKPGRMRKAQDEALGVSISYNTANLYPGTPSCK